MLSIRAVDFVSHDRCQPIAELGFFVESRGIILRRCVSRSGSAASLFYQTLTIILMLALTNVAEPDWPGRQSRGQARRRNARRPSPFRKDDF
jgi:hypothetical protein